MTTTIRRVRSLASRLVLGLLLTAAVSAQEPPQDLTVPAELTATALESRIAALASAQLDDANRNTAREAYQKALEFVRAGDESQQDRLRWQGEAATAVADLQDVDSDLKKDGTVPLPDADTPLPKLEGELERRQTELSTSQAELAGLELELAHRTDRRVSLPQRIPAAQSELTAVEQKLAAAADPDTHPVVVTARRTRRLAQQRALQLEITAAEQELQTYAATEGLLNARRDLATRRTASLQAAVRVLQERVQAGRTEQARRAEQTAREAVQDLAGRHPLLVELAKKNAELAHQRTELTELHAERDKNLAAVKAEYERLKQDLKDVRKREADVGPIDAIGALLRQRRSQLAEVAAIAGPSARQIRTEMTDSQLARFDADEQRQAQLDTNSVLDSLFAKLDPPIDDPVRLGTLRSEAAKVLAARLETLDDLRLAHSRLFELLVQLSSTRHLLTELVDEYRDYVNGRVLWIRSSQPLWSLNAVALGEAVRWTTDPRSWAGLPEAAARGLAAEPAIALWMLLAIGPLLLRRLSRRRIAHHAVAAAKSSCTSYLPTALTALHTVLLAMPAPLIVFALGDALSADPLAEPFTRAFGSALIRTSWLLAALLFVREVARHGGIGEVHFLWNAAALKRLRRATTRFALPSVPAMFVVDMLDQQGNPLWIGSLGRLALLVALGAVVVYMWCTLHPRSGAVAQARASTSAQQWRRLWFLVGLATPAAFVLLVVFGYGFTTVQLLHRLEATLAVVIVLVITQAAIVRGLFLAQRRLAIERAKERRKAAKEARARSDAESGATAEVPVVEELQIDPATVAVQARKLIAASLWVIVLLVLWQIWVDMLPALGGLRGVVLWSDESVEPALEVTLAHLLLSLLLVLVTVLSARNAPGFLELALLRRIGMAAGERNAVRTLVSYAIYLIGFIAAFSAVGIGWSKVQWLIAAISVGLGFGLQEIFANFVSGLILLFERPIRVGDAVTVGDTLGRVSKIRIRATTIIDWDRRELIVPNKEFVTGRFVNWTLSDPISRVVIPVGIAYGSDTERAREIMLEVLRGCAVVLDEPKPKVIFRRFGDSSLDFEMRAFIKDLDDWPRLMNEVHVNLDQAFRRSGVAIPFPQRDLHIRSADALVERLGPGAAPGEIGQSGEPRTIG